MRIALTIAASLSLMACRHDSWEMATQPKPAAPMTLLHSQTCSVFLDEVDNLSLRELKAENDRWQRQPSDRSDDVRPVIVAGIYHMRNRNYQRAFDLLSPLSNRKNLDEGCRSSVHLVSNLLSDILNMEKDLAFEKRQKGELEHKLKALSDIEKDLSTRETKPRGL